MSGSVKQIVHLSQEIEHLLDWLDAQFDAGRTYEEITAEPYYKRLVNGMAALRREKWGRCAECQQMTQTCTVEMLATGAPVAVCPNQT